MANYIHHTNQTLLWNAVNKIPEFQKLSPPKKDLEFKQIIEHFYRIISHKSVLSIPELQQINRETLTAFIPKLSQTPSLKPPLYPQPSQQTQSIRPIKMFETKQELSQRQFEERQNIYREMNSKPDLPSPEIFKEKEEESAIENMDILIEQFQKQREIEFNQFIPPPSVSSIQISQNGNKTKNNPKIRILEDISENEKENLYINDFEDEKKEIKKNVSWSSSSNKEYTIEDYWENKINKLEKRIYLLEEQLIRTEVYSSLEHIINKIY